MMRMLSYPGHPLRTCSLPPHGSDGVIYRYRVLSRAVTMEVSFTDASSGSDDPNINHFYLVRSVTGAGVVSATSSGIGEFDFGLSAGQ